MKSDELLNGDGTGEHVLGIIRKPRARPLTSTLIRGNEVRTP